MLEHHYIMTPAKGGCKETEAYVLLWVRVKKTTNCHAIIFFHATVLHAKELLNGFFNHLQVPGR